MSTNYTYKIDISIAKALGIILMVVGHSNCPTLLHDFIYMFHMPLFFLVAGYCFKEEYLNNPKRFILRRFYGLWIPFVSIAIIFLLLHNLFISFNLIEGIPYTFLDIFNRAKSIIISLHKEEALIGGFWFIPQLLFSSLISFTLLKFFNKKHALLFAITLSIIFKYLDILIPYTAISWITFFASAFFISGNILSCNNNIANWRFLPPFIVLIGSLLIPSGIFVDHVWKILPYFFIAISGCIFILNISKTIALNNNWFIKLLLFIGSKTMWILTLHLLAFKLVTLLIIYIKDDSILNLRITPIHPEYSNYGIWIIYSLFGVLIPIGIAYLKENISHHNNISYQKKS